MRPESTLENVVLEIKEGKLTLTIDLGERLRPSSTGKTTLVATGSAKLPNNMGLSLTVWAK